MRRASTSRTSTCGKAARTRSSATSLSPEEKKEAERLYPGASFSHGIGVAVSASGTEDDVPELPRRPSGGRDESASPGPAHQDVRLLGPAGLFAAVAAAIVAIGVFGELFEDEPPPIDKQVSTIEGRLAAGKAMIRGRRMNLRGSGEKAYFYEVVNTGNSHELLVYDIDGDHVERKFRFRPKPLGQTYEFLSSEDVDDDGREELMGSYRTKDGRRVLPFLVEWDVGEGEYRLVSLQRKPEVRSVSARAAIYRRVLEMFDDKDDDVVLRGFPSYAAAITPGPNHRLVTGYKARRGRGALEVHGNIVAFGESETRLTRCTLPKAKRVLAPVDTSLLPSSRVRRAWLEAAKAGDCSPDQVQP